MKATHITIEYAATRSRDYQSVRLGANVEIELSDGDHPVKVIETIRPALMRAVDGFERESGCFSLRELESIRNGWGRRIERDLHFTPAPVSAILDKLKSAE